jgi:hypothetical protein
MTTIDQIESFAVLGCAFREWMADFANAVDINTLALVQKGLQQGLGRKITKLIGVTQDDDGTFRGEFQQYVNPRLTKRFKFVYGENELSFTPLNGEDIQKFSEEIEDFARQSKSGRAGKALNCRIEQCGGRCLKSGETCRLTPSLEQKKLWSQASGKNLATKPETSLAKKRREMKETRRKLEKAASIEKVDNFIKQKSPPPSVPISQQEAEGMMSALQSRWDANGSDKGSKYDNSSYIRAITAVKHIGNKVPGHIDDETLTYMVDKSPNGKPKDPLVDAALNRALPHAVESLTLKKATHILDIYPLTINPDIKDKDYKTIQQLQAGAIKTLKKAVESGDQTAKRRFDSIARTFQKNKIA